MKKYMVKTLLSILLVVCMVLGSVGHAEAKEKLIWYTETDEEWELTKERAGAIMCSPPRSYWKVVEVDDDEVEVDVIGVTYVNTATKTFFVGSEDASSMDKPFNAWYDILSQLLCEGLDGEDWHKDKYAGAFSAIIAKYKMGWLSESDANAAFEEMATYIINYAKNTLGQSIGVSYNIKKADGTPFSDTDKLFCDGKEVDITYKSASGKEIVVGNADEICANQEETIKSAKVSGKGTVKINWSNYVNLELNGEVLCGFKESAAEGFQIRYSTDKSFKTGVKTKTLTNGDATSATLKGLKSGKTYYVQIRAYDKVNGKKSYCSWSKKKSVKVK